MACTRQLIQASLRRLSTSAVSASVANTERLAVVATAHGDPEESLELQRSPWLPTKPLNKDDIALRWLAAPLNPSDMNMIEGTYAIRPEVPFVPGSEGVAEVLEVGSGVDNLRAGDLVLPSEPCLGTWQSHAVVHHNDVFAVPSAEGVDVRQIGTIAVNPCTAFRMLSDFVDLVPGDTVVQTGATSQVGQAVVQIAKDMGVNTINIIRNSNPETEALQREHLHHLGATHVVLADKLRDDEFKSVVKELGAPRLALNCVSGRIGNQLQRVLGEGGTCVTYGAMARRPLEVGAASLIFKDLHFVGFWMTRWNKVHNKAERTAMLEHLLDLMRRGKLCGTFRDFALVDYRAAVSASNAQHKLEKAVFVASGAE